AATPFPVKDFETVALSGFEEGAPLPNLDARSFVPKDKDQGTLKSIIEKIPAFPGVRRGFTVNLEEDLQHPDIETWLQKCADGQSSESEQRHRHQAAGEYIAAYSHLLLAVRGNGDDAETAAVINARQRGLTPQLLPVASRLPLSLGPTLQVFPTEPNQQPNKTPEHKIDWNFQWLFPPQNRSDVPELVRSGPSCARRMDQLQDGLGQLTATAHQMLWFANQPIIEESKAKEHLQTFLSYPESDTGSPTRVYDELSATAPEYLQRIKRVADFRRRATNAKYTESAEAKKNLRTLFLFSLFAALLLDSFNHWHTQNEPVHLDHTAHESAGHEGETASKDLHTHELQQTPDIGDADDSQVGKVEIDSENESTGETDYQEPDEKKAHDGTNGSKEESNESAVPCGASIIARLFRFLLGVGGATFVVLALRFFYIRRPGQSEEKEHDLRALAESSRVQMVWFMAGIGRSVSANYMLRQRGEFNWIRQAVRSISFPYEDITWHFRRLERSMQIKMLRCVLHNWVRGHEKNAQSNYFASSQQQQIHALHFWHKLGSILVLTGLLLLGSRVAASAVDLFTLGHTFDAAAVLVWNHYLCWLLLFPVMAFLILVTKQKGNVLGACKGLTPLLKHFLEKYVRTKEAIVFAHDKHRFGKQLRKNFLAYLIPAVILALLIYLFAVMLSQVGYLPSVSNLVTIFSAVALVCGALSIAWPEKNLKSELAFQYGTMQQMFASTANYMEVQLMKLTELCTFFEDRSAVKAVVLDEHEKAKGDEDVQLAGDELDEKVDEKIQSLQNEFDQIVRQLQDALFDLGQEALDENAEWLILHRARPLEPVLAG
ncbi:MAG: hypothetical protein KDA87_24535, partial [Planctomycetales bacterium]|nr:hypothetical protein [Planctomycetales bacterium]